MTEKEPKKEYTNGEITIVWKPRRCIHSGLCVKALPEVYQPEEKPWIKVDATSTNELKAQVGTCPSGALSYYMNDEKDREAEILETKVEVLKNGPLLIYGTLKVTDKYGSTDTKNRTTAFCRCGASKNKPYCDGAHVAINFKDE